MTFLHGVLLALFAFATASALFWTWRKRWSAERRAQRASEMAAIGEQIDEVAHDVGNLISLMQINLSLVEMVDQEERVDVIKDVKESAALVSSMFQDLRGRDGGLREATSEELLTTLTQLIRRIGVQVELEVTAPFELDGPPLSLVRVLENLLVNAAREAILAGVPVVAVSMNADRVAIRNRVREPDALPEAIYESGVSLAGSSGRGLAIARSSAVALGCSLRHRVEGHDVVFIVEREPADAVVAPIIKKGAHG